MAKLKVAEDWFAPVHRGRAEYAWLQAAAAVEPSCVPALPGWSERENGFAMEFASGNEIYLWKDALLQASPFGREAAAVATVLGRLHAAPTALDLDRTSFDNATDIGQLRLDPYLRLTAGCHQELAQQKLNMAESLLQNSTALDHGDVSRFQGPPTPASPKPNSTNEGTGLFAAFDEDLRIECSLTTCSSTLSEGLWGA